MGVLRSEGMQGRSKPSTVGSTAGFLPPCGACPSALGEKLNLLLWGEHWTQPWREDVMSGFLKVTIIHKNYSFDHPPALISRDCTQSLGHVQVNRMAHVF